MSNPLDAALEEFKKYRIGNGFKNGDGTSDWYIEYIKGNEVVDQIGPYKTAKERDEAFERGRLNEAIKTYLRVCAVKGWFTTNKIFRNSEEVFNFPTKFPKS